MLAKRFLASFHIVSCLIYFSMGSRANTIEHTTSLRFNPSISELEDKITKGVALGIMVALDQCQTDFKWNRWNCSELEFSRRYLSPINKEMAYVSSITAAGIAYAVARSCARGKLFPECECMKKEKSASFVDEGCAVDLKLGQKVSRMVLAEMEGGAHDLTSRVNRHNYELGIEAVELKEGEKCKCHGISGSCTTRTCWGRVAPFAKVGRILKGHWRKALRVAANRDNDMTKEKKGVMLFLDESPDYCKPNVTFGWPGTEGRICSRRKSKLASRTEKRSCQELCRHCGHQILSRQIETLASCNCSFKYCCHVQCGRCKKTVEQFYCDARPILLS